MTMKYLQICNNVTNVKIQVTEEYFKEISKKIDDILGMDNVIKFGNEDNVIILPKELFKNSIFIYSKEEEKEKENDNTIIDPAM